MFFRLLPNGVAITQALGASAYGGEGSVFGVIIGAVLMGVINQGMSIMGIDANYQKAVKGLVLLMAIIFDVMSNKKKK